jgi:hypothetical protein
VAHQQVNQAARGLAAAGAIRRAPGSDGVIRNYLEAAGMPPRRVQGQSGRDGVSPSQRAWPVLGCVVAGIPVARDNLTRLGFVEHPLKLVTDADVPEGGLIGWDTLGPVPDAPGLYCFVGLKDPSNELRVFYVGMTSHLWMVAKGQLPDGIARGGPTLRTAEARRNDSPTRERGSGQTRRRRLDVLALAVCCRGAN